MGFEMVYQRGFLAISHNQVSSYFLEFPGAALGVAAGGHDRGGRIGASSPAHYLARVRISRAGNCAGIDHINIRLVTKGYNLVTALIKTSLEGFDFVEIEFATHVLKSYAQPFGW